MDAYLHAVQTLLLVVGTACTFTLAYAEVKHKEDRLDLLGTIAAIFIALLILQFDVFWFLR